MFPIILSVVLGSFGFILLLFLWFWRRQEDSSLGDKLPNGTNCYVPFLGQTIAFLKSHPSFSTGDFLQRHCSKYGKVFRSHLFGSPTIVSCDFNLNTFILQNEGKLFQSSYPKPVQDILGPLSMILVSGDLHKKLRTVALNFINASRPNILNYIEKLSLRFMDSLRDKNQVLFFPEAKKLTFYLMVKVLVNVDAEEGLGAEVLKDFLTFMKGFVSLPLPIPGTAYYNAVKARKRIASTLKDHLMRKRENSKNGENPKVDFVDELISKQGLDDDERVSILLDLLLAGYETTSGLMALTVYFIAQSPSTLQNLREEHMALRKDDGAPLSWEDYKKMDFTSNVINEALRCGNLVKFVHRKALKDVKFKEFVIPVGWQVLPIISATHLDPSLHHNPSSFNPWRWDEDPMTSRKVSPFGGGVRICPGAELGKLETAIFLHHFVLNFRWEIIGNDQPMLCPYMEFKGGLPLQVQTFAPHLG